MCCEVWTNTSSDLGLLPVLYSGVTPYSAQETGCSDRDPTGLAVPYPRALPPRSISLSLVYFQVMEPKHVDFLARTLLDHYNARN